MFFIDVLLREYHKILFSKKFKTRKCNTNEKAIFVCRGDDVCLPQANASLSTAASSSTRLYGYAYGSVGENLIAVHNIKVDVLSPLHL